MPLSRACRLNTIPHERSTRQYFYRDAVSGVLTALAAGETRMVARWGAPAACALVPRSGPAAWAAPIRTWGVAGGGWGPSCATPPGNPPPSPHRQVHHP